MNVKGAAGKAGGLYKVKSRTTQLSKNIRFSFDGKEMEYRLQEGHIALQAAMASSFDARMPMRDNILRDATRARNAAMLGTEYVYAAAGTPYGRFQYYGRVMVGVESRSPYANKGEKKETTDRPLRYSRPEATAEWAEAAAREDMKAWRDAVERALNGG